MAGDSESFEKLGHDIGVDGSGWFWQGSMGWPSPRGPSAGGDGCSDLISSNYDALGKGGGRMWKVRDQQPAINQPHFEAPAQTTDLGRMCRIRGAENRVREHSSPVESR